MSRLWVATGGASEANACRGKYIEYFEDSANASLRAETEQPNAEIGSKDIFETASKFLRLLALVILLAGMATGELAAGAKEDRQRLREQITNHATLHIDFWGMDWAGRSLTERIHPAPKKVIDKIRLENRLYGFKERPEPVAPPPEVAIALDTILMNLPVTIQNILNDRLIGLLTVNNLGGTGYSEVVYDAQKRERYGIIILDAAVLVQKRANEWASWKTNSMFRSRPGRSVKVRAILEEDHHNTIVNSIRFILLHEIGHILGMATSVHPSWLVWQAGRRVDVASGFSHLSWKNGAGKTIVSRFDDRFPERTAIKAYAFDKAQLTVAQIPIVYTILAKHTNFHTLYACESPWEDWAESFATYYHVVIDQRPWQVVIEAAGRPDQVIESCWGMTRCREKEAYLQNWFKNPVRPAE